jgi:hypothetical protein
VKKYKDGGEWKDKLTVRMDFSVRGVATILHISFGALYTHTQILYFYFIPLIVFDARSRK